MSSTYWGDIHAHCAASYGNGTPARAIDNARQHLDFCSITGHAFWPDMPMDLIGQSRIIGMHYGGFQKLQYFWKELVNELKHANKPGEFVTFPSYEWHSCEYGDYNCYFNSFNVSLIDGLTPADLAEKIAKQPGDSMMVPHHCAYTKGHRGTEWDAFDDTRSPIVEIFSNHGCGEADDAYFEYHHSMGPRSTETSVREGLLQGHRFGFYASTDTHDGYPGHYGHGRVGVMAPRLDKGAIWKALKQRRTIASTGARITADVQLGSGRIGDVIKHKAGNHLALNVQGTAPIDKVELIEAAGSEWHVRKLPGNDISSRFVPGQYKVKVETGWGRAGTQAEWHVKAKVRGGTLLGADPCFRYSDYPMSELTACDRIRKCNSRMAEWQCRTLPNPAGLIAGTHFAAGGTQAVILDIDATERTRLDISCGDIAFDLPVQDLVRGSVAQQTGPLGSPAIKIHRAVPEGEFTFRHEEPYTPLAEKKGFIYLRITQTDGQTAWVSPIWIE
jgi:hypothetical protein